MSAKMQPKPDEAGLARAAERGRRAGEEHGNPRRNPYGYNTNRHLHIAWRDAHKVAWKAREAARGDGS